jgi:hypothetical protein
MNCPYRIWRDPLVGADEHRLMAHAASPGTTSVPLRGISRRHLLVRSAV